MLKFKNAALNMNIIVYRQDISWSWGGATLPYLDKTVGKSFWHRQHAKRTEIYQTKGEKKDLLFSKRNCLCVLGKSPPPLTKYSLYNYVYHALYSSFSLHIIIFLQYMYITRWKDDFEIYNKMVFFLYGKQLSSFVYYCRRLFIYCFIWVLSSTYCYLIYQGRGVK